MFNRAFKKQSVKIGFRAPGRIYSLVLLIRLISLNLIKYLESAGRKQELNTTVLSGTFVSGKLNYATCLQGARVPLNATVTSLLGMSGSTQSNARYPSKFKFDNPIGHLRQNSNFNPT